MAEQSSHIHPIDSHRPERSRVPRLFGAAVTVLLVLSAVTALEGLVDSTLGQRISAELVVLGDPHRWVP